ncbi:hypothetical protein T440DRAFT_115455 [Plenodomus tracheiphilus IPT5]|uniref:A to I editase domain-containing protein n=1 Tax=Plenodomus tracheiphilus IPT5 TaxID=1408161 RepID=A0A6A7B6W9_9PLEO|nr:hypothetical protein T440DRAFT_115455 [Plenodomus tracheiphilus IPT5]
MKCLPSNKLPLAQGNILHDWHAEIVAIRAFNRYLLDQCLQLSTPPHTPSDFLRRRTKDEYTAAEPQPFTIKENVHIHMYCSEAPCGDASMELVMSAQEDATPWTTAPPTITSPTSTPDPSSCPFTTTNKTALRGRSNFSHLGAVRCKPSRPDAPPTASKSCTDKLALKQATSLLSSTTSLLISPSNAYIHTLTLPTSQLVPSACERAFSRSGRLHNLLDSSVEGWKGGYKFSPFEVRGTSREFGWSRRMVGGSEKAMPSNLSAVWTPGWQETLIGGVLQGRKQTDPRGASAICRRKMWGLAVQVAGVVGGQTLVGVLGKRKYESLKEDEALEGRRKVKEDMKRGGLQGWVKNIGDDGFSLEENS